MSRERVQLLNEHIRDNSDQKPHDVANYIARITDKGEDDTLALGTIGLAELQAVVTHRHPNGVLSALLLCDAFTIASQEPLPEHARADLAILQTRLPHAWADDEHLQQVLALLTDDPHTYLASAIGPEPGSRGPSIEQAYTAAAERLAIETHSTGWAETATPTPSPPSPAP